jgi:hypothetical protein
MKCRLFETKSWCRKEHCEIREPNSKNCEEKQSCHGCMFLDSVRRVSWVREAKT